jgi:hypothetical protein
MEFVKALAVYRSTHYPQRSAHIYIINAPVWFSAVWAAISRLIDPRTKVRQCSLSSSATPTALLPPHRPAHQGAAVQSVF